MSEKKQIPKNNGLNSGLVIAPHDEKDHIVGGVTVGGLQIIKPEAPIIFEDGHGWIEVGENSGESGEVQSNAIFDSFLCTIFGVAAALSDYFWGVYKIKKDISECIQGVLAGVKPGVGGTIRNSLESFRTMGWADEALRKFTQSTTQAQCFAAVTDAIKNICKEQLKDWDIYWDVIDTSDNVPHSKIIAELKKGEVIVTLYAWASYYGQVGIFHDYNYMANHCCRIVEGGNIPQSVKDKFKGRDYEIDWSLADLIAKDTYRFNWKTDEADHSNVNDFLKPLSKDFRIWSAHRIYALPKSKKKTYLSLLKKSMENFYYYWDGKHNFYYIGVPAGETTKFRQHIALDPSNTNENFLFIALKGSMNQSSWPEVSQYPDISTINKKFA